MICYFLAVCVIRVMKETPTYSVNLSTPARNLTEAAVTGRYCPHIGLKKKCTYTLIDNIDTKELNTLQVNYLLGKGAIENFGSFFLGDYEWPSFLIVDGFFFC